ncbi:uncharacterized protein VP01_4689g1 [Puccinia sorghi]|uniref:GAG-pre-integrase domain-containing protein n=1 Tax=Puccinia sorghi TaxID=27349 RepID=A0A0L6UN44_9BASI|nr:uncharacterized protein VP01_4689g1 [Puccinia sorghi]
MWKTSLHGVTSSVSYWTSPPMTPKTYGTGFSPTLLLKQWKTLQMHWIDSYSTKLQNPLIIHHALGHPSLAYLKRAYPDLKVADLPCEDCDRAKMHQQPFVRIFPTFSTPLDCEKEKKKKNLQNQHEKYEEKFRVERKSHRE